MYFQNTQIKVWSHQIKSNNLLLTYVSTGLHE